MATSVYLDEDSTYLLNKYFILPVLSLNTSVMNLDSTVNSFNNSSSVIANTSSITMLNASVLANTSSIINLNSSINTTIAVINSSISQIKATALTLNTSVSNLSIYVTNLNISVNSSITDINTSIIQIKTTVSTLNTSVSNLNTSVTTINTSLINAIDTVNSTTLTIGGTNGTSSQSYGSALTSGTLNIATAITTGNINIGTANASNQVNVGGVLVGVNAINAGTNGTNFQIASTNTSGSISIGDAQTSGVLNIGTNSTRTSTGFINIGNSNGSSIINLETGNTNNTFATPAISIGGAGAGAKWIKIGNTNTGVNATSVSLCNLRISQNNLDNHVSTGGDIAFGASQTSGVLYFGGSAIRTSSGAINIGNYIGNQCPVNIMSGGGATTGGSVNIANGTLQTTTVNIASGTGTGAVTIGNSANTTSINSKNIEIGNNANTSTIIIGPLSQTTSLNISTVVNGVRIDSHAPGSNLFLSFGNTSYKVAYTGGGTGNFCNTALSNLAFSVNPMTGDHCTAVGHNCLTKNSTGKWNIAIGADTLANVTTGSFNTALGGFALANVITGSNNVAVGYNALASSLGSAYPNVAVGHGTLQNYNNSPGGGNVALGYNALASLTTGVGNIAIGYIADNAPNVAPVNTTGSDNVVIGTDACSANKNRCIVIGHSAAPSADDQIIIGKSTGAHTTYIQGSGGFNVNGGPCSLLGLTVKTTQYQQQWGIGKNADTALWIQAIGYNTGVYMTPSYTSWASGSDRSLKENIIPMESMINKIMNLNPVRYNLIDVSGDRVGFIAQEFMNYFPEFITESRGKLGIMYTELISVLTKCIQEQETKIINLETKNEELISRLSAIEARMAAAGI